jgi:trehalose 6-phosphate phosphatase
LHEHLPQVASRFLDASQLLLLLTYDGTLTPIVDHPGNANLSSDTLSNLTALAARQDCTVAIFSGRSLGDLKNRVPVPGIIYAGNHGLEIQGPDFHYTHPAAITCQDRVQEVATRLQSDLSAIPGAWLEDKKLSLSIHLRQVHPRDISRVQDALLRAMRYQIPYLLISTGIHVLEVRPRVDWDKGKAALLLRQRTTLSKVLTVGIGADSTDEDLLRALRDGITIKVGRTGNSIAEYMLSSPEEVQEFLQWMAALPSSGQDSTASDAGVCHS